MTSPALAPLCAAPSSDILFKDWVAQFLENYVYPVYKPSSAAHFADNLLKHALPVLGNYQLSALTAPLLQSFLNEQTLHGNLVTHGPLSGKSVKNLRTALNCCLRTAVTAGLISQNPVPNTVIRRSTKPTIKPLSDPEFETLRSFLYQDGNLMNIGLILALEFGLRRGEVCGLQWQDIDSDLVYLTVHRTVKRLDRTVSGNNSSSKTELVFGSTKTDASERTLAIPPHLGQLLLLHQDRYFALFGRDPEPADFVCYNSVGTLTDPDNLSHYFSDVLCGLGLPHARLHDLRHTFATRAVEQGVDIESISGLLGHTDVTTTTHYYLHPRQNAMNAAMWKLSSAPGSFPTKLPVLRSGKAARHTYGRRTSFDACTAPGEEAV